MATIRLIPSAYTLSNTSYLSISNASNMYANTDNTTYAQVTHNRSQNSTYYLYIHGFNFDDIDDSWTINSFSVKIKALESSLSTSSSYRCSLYHSTSSISNTTLTSSLSTTATTYTFPTSTLDWETLKEYGNNFRIRVPLRRASSGTSGYVRVYGAEIEVNYTVPVSATVTSTLTGNGTISPSGATSTYENTEYTLTITPTNKSDTVTATKNGVDITSELVAHGAGSTITATPSNVTTSSIQSGASYAEYAVGYSAESPSSSGTSSNMYAASGSTGYAEYSFDFSNIPSGATIEEIEVRCYGHRENSTIDSTHVSQCVIYNGSTAISEEVDFPSTSNSIITLTPTTIPSSMSNVTVRHYVGYYGGLVLGISFEVTYSTGSGIDHYIYTYTVDGDATIAVTIGAAATPKLYVKINGAWVEVAEAYKKINGSWVQQSDVTTVFTSGINYLKGN